MQMLFYIFIYIHGFNNSFLEFLNYLLDNLSNYYEEQSNKNNLWYTKYILVDFL